MRYVIERNNRPSLFCWEVMDNGAKPVRRRIASGKREDMNLVAEALNEHTAARDARDKKAA